MTQNTLAVISHRLVRADQDHLSATLYLLLDNMTQEMSSPEPSIQPLYDLIEQLRPASSTDSAETRARFDVLLNLLAQDARRYTVLAQYMLNLMRSYTPAQLYSEIGILGNEGFFSAMMERIVWHVIPPLQADYRIEGLFNTVFYKSTDEVWLAHVAEDQWFRLIQGLSTSKPDSELLHDAQHYLLNALMVLSYRVAAMGLEPELLRIDPTIEEFESPFMAQNREIIQFTENYQPLYADHEHATPETPAIPVYPDERPAEVMIEQCRTVLHRVRRNTKRYGVSIRLTNLMLRIDQTLTRMELLFELLLSFQRIPYLAVDIAEADRGRNKAVVAKEISYAVSPLLTTLKLLTEEKKNHASIRKLISTHTELLSLQVTEHASKTGGHYVTDNRRGYLLMLRSAMGAGAIIAVMATIKVLLGRFALAPIVKAFTQSMNYSFGFMLIHVLHFTVATKQPAMTAATIAATIHKDSKTKDSKTQQNQLTDLARLTINIIRTQFIAIIGNISVAMPVGALIAYLWQSMLPEPLLTPAKAVGLLHDINPFHSLALPHAAIAGVCLFLSGLIAGYYDNLAVYHGVGARLRQHPVLQRWLSPVRLDKVTSYIENNLGALAGNFWFGVMLGSMGTLGYILGLPLDIRHIAFASVNFAQSVYTLRANIDIGTVAVSFLGVLLIGMTNLLVSFSLALFVALKSRQIAFKQWIPLGELILGHLSTRPTDFVLPPTPLQPKAAGALADEQSNVTSSENTTKPNQPDANVSPRNPVSPT